MNVYLDVSDMAAALSRLEAEAPSSGYWTVYRWLGSTVGAKYRIYATVLEHLLSPVQKMAAGAAGEG